MKGFFIYGIRVPREWRVKKEMERGMDFNDMAEEINKSIDGILIYYYINTRNGDEMLFGKSLPVLEENKDSRTIIVPEISKKDKWAVMCGINDYFSLDFMNTKYNLYYVGEYS